MGAFDWVNFKDGRACFSGGVRGWDELGHETFCVDVDGQELFGEVRKLFAANQNDYDLEIISFGYRSRTAVGMPDDPARVVLTEEQAHHVAELIRDLVIFLSKQEDRPIALYQDATSRFLGRVYFNAGWVRTAG